jgi:hypothetical protein
VERREKASIVTPLCAYEEALYRYDFPSCVKDIANYIDMQEKKMRIIGWSVG